jgi:hypothetical protein
MNLRKSAESAGKKEKKFPADIADRRRFFLFFFPQEEITCYCHYHNNY